MELILEPPVTICAEDELNPGAPIYIEAEKKDMAAGERQRLELKHPLPECPRDCYFWYIHEGLGKLQPQNDTYTIFTAPDIPIDQKDVTAVAVKVSGRITATIDIMTNFLALYPAYSIWNSWALDWHGCRPGTHPWKYRCGHQVRSVINYYNCYGGYIFSMRTKLESHLVDSNEIIPTLEAYNKAKDMVRYTTDSMYHHEWYKLHDLRESHIINIGCYDIDIQTIKPPKEYNYYRPS